MYKTDYKPGDQVMIVGPRPKRPARLPWLPGMKQQLGGPWTVSQNDLIAVKLQGDPRSFWYDFAWLEPYEPDPPEDEAFSLMEVLL